MSHPARLETLADLRVEIDCIDSELHQLLIKRGEIIHRLIEAKARTGGGQGGGSAFRPAREADMMRGLVARHRGLLPLDTVEGIWRIIISTFTYAQAPYSVHADVSGGDAEMRDCCRFHFGFTVPYAPHRGADSVIAAVAGSTGDLGLIPVEGDAAAGPWWRRLAEPRAPKIIARLPFVERRDHPAGLPLYVVAQPLAEATARDVCVHAVTADGWQGPLPGHIESVGAEIVAAAADAAQLALLVSADGAVSAHALRLAMIDAGAIAPHIVEIGGHAARFDASEAKPAPARAKAAQ